MADLCSRIHADLDLDSPTHVVEVSDLHSPAHDVELTKNLCPVTCEKPCACSNTSEEKKKSPLDLSEIKEKVEEILELFEDRDFENKLLEEAIME